jgi:hypothetical protein
MSTPPVVKQNTFEHILTGIGKFIEKVINVEINVAVAEKPLIDRFLPANVSQAIDAAEQVALTTYLQIEAQEQAIGASSAPFATKVAQVLALQGLGITKILATAGLETTQNALSALVTGATSFTQIGLSNITTLQPVPIVNPAPALTLGAHTLAAASSGITGSLTATPEPSVPLQPAPVNPTSNVAVTETGNILVSR